ncbi:hypothetical protein O3P69_020310 [Scylla paramamosain]|uniref:Uncharacterized protein n=1 Tax=Scylla paramamosain TaxID=85552 RepID=A0AAW0SIU3_SCYPA
MEGGDTRNNKKGEGLSHLTEGKCSEGLGKGHYLEMHTEGVLGILITVSPHLTAQPFPALQQPPTGRWAGHTGCGNLLQSTGVCRPRGRCWGLRKRGCEYGLSSPSVAITTGGTKGCSSPPQTPTEATGQETAPGEKGGAGEDEEVLASPVNSQQSLKTVGPLEKVKLWQASLILTPLVRTATTTTTTATADVDTEEGQDHMNSPTPLT